MSVSESEFFATGMSLPPDVRKRAALRLLESVDPDEAFAVARELVVDNPARTFKL